MPSPEEMAASGFCADDFEADPVELWPENARAWQVFADMSGQWRPEWPAGPAGQA